jgi:hypothetical protein
MRFLLCRRLRKDLAVISMTATCAPTETTTERSLHLFRGLFLDKLRAAYRAGAPQFFGKHTRLIDPRAFAAYLAPLWSTKWVVYCKRPFGA